MILHDPANSYPGGEHHHLDLERGAVRALERGDVRLAYCLADRRCRILPLPEPEIYILRAEALFRLGYKTAALGDVTRAIEIAPDDITATRRMLSWGIGAPRLEAAIAIAHHDNDATYLRHALALMHENGREAFARIDVLDDEVSGWVTWTSHGAVRLTLSSWGETRTTTLAPDPSHRLVTERGRAANFRMIRPRSADSQSLAVSCEGIDIATVHFPGNEARVPSNRIDLRPVGPRPRAQDIPLTVIVPVYADYSATKACLDSLLQAMASTSNLTVLVVDDASPDDRIKHYLSSIASLPGVSVIANASNLGFVGAINRGLGLTQSGDIVLLNSDTLVPPLALARLRDVVAAGPDIGTATPLSNNGEFTSFPIANRSNPLPSAARVAQLDALASQANAGQAVDIPNGIGFCLYLTRACLNAVGELSESFHRGYLEDVDLCLRAREAGFRNVCVPSVYVGHAGSRSFRQEKRSLVVRNLRVLERRYPGYRVECAAFALADPLRRSRDLLERAILAAEPDGAVRVILSGSGAAREVAASRAVQLAAEDLRCLLIDFHSDGARRLARLSDPSDGVPQSISYDVSDMVEREAFERILLELSPEAIEIAEPRRVPDEVTAFIRDRKLPYHMLICDDGLAPNAADEPGVRADWREIVDGASSIIATSARARDFARSRLGLDAQTEDDHLTPARPKHVPARHARCLGVPALRASAEEFVFLKQLSLCLAKRQPDIQIVVLGQTLDDLALMRFKNTFVTGKVDPSELETLIKGYDMGKLLLGIGAPLFAHPMLVSAESSALPRATFEWMSSPGTLRKGDLHIAATLPAADAIELIAGWLQSEIALDA